MSRTRSAVVLTAAALAIAGLWAEPAEARPGHRHFRHHHHHGHGLAFGLGLAIVTAPLWLAPRYAYPAPVYYAPPPPPTVYVEQPPPPAYWYYCPDAQAYYPYVQNCASAWQRVLPRPQ